MFLLIPLLNILGGLFDSGCEEADGGVSRGTKYRGLGCKRILTLFNACLYDGETERFSGTCTKEGLPLTEEGRDSRTGMPSSGNLLSITTLLMNLCGKGRFSPYIPGLTGSTYLDWYF